MSPLPQEVEDYLGRLNKALWLLSDGERVSTVREIRGHFEDRWSRGRLHLLSAIEHMGPAEDMARAFVEASGRHWHGRPVNENADNLPSTVVRSTALVPYVPPRRRLPWREVYGCFRDTVAASRNGLWSVAGVTIVALTALDFVSTAHTLSGAEQGMPPAPAAMLRLAVVVAALVAAYRALLTHDDLIWLPGWPTMKFAAINVLVLGTAGLVATGANAWIAAWLAPGLLCSLAGAVAIAAAWAVCAGVFLRINPWLVGLAIEDDRLTMLGSVERTAPNIRSLLTAWLMFVVPLMLGYALTSALTQKLAYETFIRIGLGLCAIDALLFALTLLAAAVLGAMSFRWATGDGVPDPAPFSTGAPTWEETARVRRVMEAWSGYRRLALLAQERASS